MLNFRLPEAFAQPHIHNQVVSRHQEAEGNWLPGEPDTANAQGIARTEEMWLYLAPANADEGNSRRLLEALDGERLRAVVDPQWVAASGAFYEIHHQDWENFPEDERMFALAARTPSRWIDRLELYGKWIYGDVATWGLNLSAQTASLYRTFRARHHGWPYSWIPYARSGDSELLKFAQASTRHMVDAAYCWHVSEDVQRSVGPHMHRRIGTWHRSLVPWAGRQNPATRGYEEKVDFAWHAYYLTNDARALDYIQSWAQQTKQEEPLRRRGAFRIGGPGQRNGVTLQKSYLEMYEATFDPWFLVAAHAIAKASLWIHEHEGWTGHFWVPAHREFLRYTGSKAYERFYLAYARDWGSHRARHGWDQLGAPMIEPNAYAWYLTGEDYFLRRVAGDLDLSRVATFRGHEPDYLVGHYTRGSAHMIYTGWWLQTFAVGLKAIVDSRQQPEPMGNTFRLGGLEHQGLVGDLRYRVPTISFVKAQAKSVTLRLGRTVLPVRAAPGEMAAYQVIDAAEQVVLAGQWEIRQSMDVQVPAELPGGVYRLVVDQPHDRGLDIPVTSMDVPEVFQVEPGQPLGWLRQEARLWFHVPGQVARFTVTFPAGQGVRQISIWGPDDELVWEHHGVSTRRTADITADIQVKPQQAGRLWRVTLPGSAPGLMMDPQIPPVFATEKSRWFLPQAHSPGSMQAD